MSTKGAIPALRWIIFGLSPFAALLIALVAQTLLSMAIAEPAHVASFSRVAHLGIQPLVAGATALVIAERAMPSRPGRAFGYVAAVLGLLYLATSLGPMAMGRMEAAMQLPALGVGLVLARVFFTPLKSKADPKYRRGEEPPFR